MFEPVVPQVLTKYAVDFTAIGDMQKGYRNESYPVQLSNGLVINLLFFKNEPTILDRINRADYASATLAGHMPVRTRYDQRLLRVKVGVYAGLYTYLPGATVPWESFTKRHIKLTGYAMADMHAAWRPVVATDSHTVADDLLPLIARMTRYFSESSVQQALHRKLGVSVQASQFELFSELVRLVSGLPGQQIIHMDMVRGNVLFRKAEPADKWSIDDLALSGVIDFEKSTVGHPVFDIARTLAFLLVDSPKPAHKVYKYFLDSGYCKRGGGTVPSSELLTALIKLFLLHDFYKFLRHAPYESLHQNHHYLRTRDILQMYGMIKASI